VNWNGGIVARTGSQQAAYHANIILYAAAEKTDEQIASELGLVVRTVWEWRLVLPRFRGRIW
jgi:hypothetical protein